MRLIIIFCALAACVSATAQEYSLYFAANGSAVLLDKIEGDKMETYAETISYEQLSASVCGAFRRLTQVVKYDDAAMLQAGSAGGLYFSFLGEKATIKLDRNAAYFAWRVTFSNQPNDYIALRYTACVEVVRDWAVRMFNGEL